MSCPYAFVFGKPGTGFHSTRFGGLALNDVVGTIIIALGTAWYFEIDWKLSMMGWFVIAEVLHYLFGCQTAFLTMMGIVACS